MLTAEKVSNLLNRSQRRIISSLNQSAIPEYTSDHAAEWREKHADVHIYREAMICLKGTVNQSLNGQVFLGEPGTLFLFDSGEKHDAGYVPDTPDGAHMWMYIMPDAVMCVGDEVINGSFAIDFRYFYRDQEIVLRLNKIWQEAADGLINTDIAIVEINAVFDLIFTDMVKNIAPGEQQLEKGSNKHQFRAIQAIMKYLDRTCGKDSSIISLARMSGYSRPHFLRLFQEIAGCRVGEYINNRRIMRYYELQTQGYSMKSIADELGFSSNAALCHWRKKRLSPEED